MQFRFERRETELSTWKKDNTNFPLEREGKKLKKVRVIVRRGGGRIRQRCLSNSPTAAHCCWKKRKLKFPFPVVSTIHFKEVKEREREEPEREREEKEVGREGKEDPLL